MLREISILMVSALLLLILHANAQAFEAQWTDYSNPLTEQLTACLNGESTEVKVDLPESFLQKHSTISLYLKFRSHVYSKRVSKEAGFIDWKPQVRINDHFFSGVYRLAVDRFPAEQDYTLKVDSDMFSPGKNTIKLSFINTNEYGKNTDYDKCLRLKFSKLEFTQAVPAPVQVATQTDRTSTFTTNIVSQPSGADVFIDGVHKGATPLSIDIAKGSYSIILEKEGYKKISEFKNINSRRMKFAFDLTPDPAKISITTSVDQVSVYVDNVLKGQTPLSLQLEQKEYAFVFKKNGYETRVEKIAIRPDTREIFRSMESPAAPAVIQSSKEKKTIAQSLVSHASDQEKVQGIQIRTSAAPDSMARIALIIGNSAYKTAPLKNPANDAEDISAALREIGFKVMTKTNANKREMLDAVYRFGAELRRADIGLFFFAGHGMQLDGTNYLIPLDTNVRSAVDVEYEAINAGRILSKMKEAGNRLNVVVLDACRNNPFRSFFRSGNSGLAKMDAPIGTIIAYATSPGSVAYDGDGRNGVFTKHLLGALRKKGLTVQQLFNEAGLGVMRETNRQQVPWFNSSPMEAISLSAGVPASQ